jgi:hypothetical protein
MAPLADFSAPVLDHLCGDSFFASGTFARLWETKGGCPVVYYLQDGSDIVAVLPGVEFGRFFLKRFMSMPDGCYGGVFCHPDHLPRKKQFIKILLDAVLGAGYIRTFVFDFEGDIEQDSRFDEIKLETTLVDISNPDWLPPDKKLQSQIRKAEREGIVVQEMAWRQHGGRFMKLMELTEKRHHRRPTYSRDFFEQLSQVSENDPRLHWVWCEFKDQGVCSHIYIIEKGVLQGWQIYFDKEFSFLKPNQYIRFTTCRMMARRGIKWLNLGGTPETAPGLSYYKKRWGGETVKYRGLVNRQGLGRFI